MLFYSSFSPSIIFSWLPAALFLLYFPFAAMAYYSLGLCITDNIVFSVSPGILQTLAQLVLLVHLSSALPILINPANQYVEVRIIIVFCGAIN